MLTALCYSVPHTCNVNKDKSDIVSLDVEHPSQLDPEACSVTRVLRSTVNLTPAEGCTWLLLVQPREERKVLGFGRSPEDVAEELCCIVPEGPVVVEGVDGGCQRFQDAVHNTGHQAAHVRAKVEVGVLDQAFDHVEEPV